MINGWFPSVYRDYYGDAYYDPMGASDHMEFYNVRGVDKRSNGQVGVIAVAAIMMGTLSFVIALM